MPEEYPKKSMEKITFELDNNEKAEFFVLEQAKLFGNNYILVTEEEEGDAEALILKEIASESGKNTKQDTTYEIVTNDDELGALSSLFESLLEDCALE